MHECSLQICDPPAACEDGQPDQCGQRKLPSRDGVLAINERLLQFEAGKPFIEIKNAAQGYDKRPVELGLSDGIVVEVLRGVSLGDVIKVPVAVSATPPR